ncbi:MAG: vWA domain-containing protein [Nanobdellota archaeon]
MRKLRKKKATYFGNITTLKRTHGFNIFHISSIVLIIKIIVIILLFMLATNSISINDIKPVSTTDYVLLIDDSSSMAKSDYKPNRLSSAKEISTRWVGILPNSTQIGLLGFSEGIDYRHQLTTDTTAIRKTIESIEIDYENSGTDLDYALRQGIDMLQGTKQDKTILLLTDGTQNVTNKTISRAINDNITIISFGIGKQEQERIVNEEYKKFYNSLEFNFTLLEEISEKTGGDAFRVEDKDSLKASLEQATFENVSVSVNSSYYIAILIAIISILELYLYSRVGAL